jgi:hypothetical protein
MGLGYTACQSVYGCAEGTERGISFAIIPFYNGSMLPASCRAQIELVGGRRVRFDRDVDPETMKRVRCRA